MSTDPREERLARRIADLYATDQQFADARPIEAITAAIDATRAAAAADRAHRHGGLCGPACARRARRPTSSTIRRPAALPSSCCPGSRPSPTASCGTASTRSCAPWPTAATIRCGPAIASACWASPASITRPIDMALVQLGAVSVPLQTSAPVSQLRPIVAETEPSVIAVECRLSRRRRRTGADGPRARLGWSCSTTAREVDDQREAFDAAKARLADADSPVTVETLADVLERGNALPPAPAFVSGMTTTR